MRGERKGEEGERWVPSIFLRNFLTLSAGGKRVWAGLGDEWSAFGDR